MLACLERRTKTGKIDRLSRRLGQRAWAASRMQPTPRSPLPRTMTRRAGSWPCALPMSWRRFARCWPPSPRGPSSPQAAAPSAQSAPQQPRAGGISEEGGGGDRGNTDVRGRRRGGLWQCAHTHANARAHTHTHTSTHASRTCTHHAHTRPCAHTHAHTHTRTKGTRANTRTPASTH